MREFRIRTCSQGVCPLAEPLGSSALDAARFTKPPALSACPERGRSELLARPENPDQVQGDYGSGGKPQE